MWLSFIKISAAATFPSLTIFALSSSVVFIFSKVMKDSTSFAGLGLNPQLIRALAEVGYQKPTEIQQKCIPPALAGQDVIGIAQTGTGKTAAYLLPVLFKTKYAQGSMPRALILVPTKELALQVAGHARALARFTDLRVVELYGGVGLKKQVEQLQQGADVVVATPGRFMEIYLRGDLPVKQLKTLVLDEADRMMDLGFMPQLRRIFEVIPQKRQNLLFSATFPPKVEQLAAEFLDFPVRVEVTPQASVPEQVHQKLYYVPNLKTKINFLAYLLEQPEFTRVLIFTRTRQAATNVFRFLERKKLGPVRVIHSNKSQNSRINALQQLKEGALRVLVSTDVSARGIDINQLSHVINFDVPVLYDDYVHRIGRTGRALATGTAITFATEADRYHVQKIEALIRQPIPVYPLPAEVEVAETPWEEEQQMRREIDEQKRKENPDYRGAFHKKKRHV
jgi:ATP-dependent RNA helicase RhlE